MRPYLKEAVYVNNLGDQESDRVRAAYGANYDRLAAVKARYDPENLFRLNHNIAPGVVDTP
jgi:FAD/FMN-containing dehydrogenase